MSIIELTSILNAVARARDQAKLAYEFSPTSYTYAAFVACNSAVLMLELTAQLDRARHRLDETIRLLERALDLRQQLWWELDLDDVTAEVDRLKRDVRLHKSWRPSA